MTVELHGVFCVLVNTALDPHVRFRTLARGLAASFAGEVPRFEYIWIRWKSTGCNELHAGRPWRRHPELGIVPNIADRSG